MQLSAQTLGRSKGELMIEDPSKSVSEGVRLYSANQTAGAAAFGGPFAGAWLMALNYSRLGRDGGVRAAIALGLLGTAGLYLLISLLPTDVPNAIGPAASSLLFWCVYRFNLHHSYAAHIESGGSKASTWKVMCVSVGAIPLSLASIVALQSLLPIPPPNQVRYGTSIIVYEGRATEEDARALGKLLQDEGIFREGLSFELTLKRPRFNDARLQEEIVISWVVPSAPKSGSDESRYFEALRKAVREELFPDARVYFEFANAFGIPVARIPET